MDLLAKLTAHAKANGISLNPDKRVLDAILAALKRSNGFCPCRQDKSPDNMCPCKSHLDDIKKDGHCHCSLFVSK